MRILYLILFVTILIWAQSAFAIDAHRARSYVHVLASDSLEGRRSGLPGGEKAAAWIAEQFKAFGLKPGVGDTSFLQDFSITTSTQSGPMVLQAWPFSDYNVGARRAAPTPIGADTINFHYGQDFVSFSYGGSGRMQGQLVFIGYGIHAPDKGHDDFAGLDLKGKIAIAVRGAPDQGEGYWEGEGWHGTKVAAACDAGAAGYLHVGDGKAMQRTAGPNNYRERFPAFWISRQACDSLMQSVGLTFDSLVARANGRPEGYHLELPVEILMESHAGVVPNAPTRNVLGCIPGADPEHAQEIVLIGGHMDHLGVDAIGRIYHGADDNASGAALVLELARTLANDPIPPRRSVFFCTFAAEELGLLGSEHFVTHPPIALDSFVAMINMDMVGLGDQGVDLGGWPNFPRIAQIWSTALSDSQKARLTHFKPGTSSDHAPFEEVGIPAFFLDSRGDHPNYHQPEDAADSIRAETLAEVGDVVYRGLRAIADYPAPLTNPNRLTDYLWQSSETVMLGAPQLPVASLDDSPDVILYEAGKTIDPSARNRLRRLLVELSGMDSLLAKADIARIKSFDQIPSGQLRPSAAVGIATPRVAEGQPEIFEVLDKLGVLFIHVPPDERGDYFGKRGMKKAGRELLAQLEKAPQRIIWDVSSFGQAQQLMAAAERPLIVRIISADDKETAKSINTNNNDFLLLSAKVAEGLTREDFEALDKTLGWGNWGVEAVDKEDAKGLLQNWIRWAYSQRKIRNLLGGNMERWLGGTQR